MSASDGTAGPVLQRIRIGNVTLAVRVEGQGEPVLLIHGFPDDGSVWRAQIPALVEAGYRVIVPDMRGCGDSDAPPEVADYRLDRLVGDLIGVLDQLGAGRVKVVGHDWGAVIGWVLAARHPERVECYVALSVGHPMAYARAGFEQKRKGWYTLFFQWRGVAERVLRARNWALFRRVIGQPDAVAHWIARLSRPGRLTAALSYYRANLGQVLFGALPPVQVPVMGVWSSRDRFLSEDQMTGSHAYVTGPWTYRRLDGVGHWMPLGAPERVNALLLAYFAQALPGGDQGRAG